VSFTAWLLKTIADEMAADGEVNAGRIGRGRNVIFDDVDIAVLGEKLVDGKAVPLPLVVRKADAKSPEEIGREVRRPLRASDRGGRGGIAEERHNGLTAPEEARPGGDSIDSPPLEGSLNASLGLSFLLP
jgi:hypothetical protein